jgi:hypothetical protein
VEARRQPVAPPPAAPAPRATAGRDAAATANGGDAAPRLSPVDPAILKESFLSEVRKAKKFFYGTVVAQAQKIEFEGDKVVFTFGPQHRALRAQLEQNRPWLESAASQLSGRKMAVVAAEGAAAGGPASVARTPSSAQDVGRAAPDAAPDRAQALKERALSDTGVQTMLDVFAAEIKDVEEM